MDMNGHLAAGLGPDEARGAAGARDTLRGVVLPKVPRPQHLLNERLVHHHLFILLLILFDRTSALGHPACIGAIGNGRHKA